MKIKLNIFFASLTLMVGFADAQVRDGSYNGLMRCGASLGDSGGGVWTQPMKLQVSGNSVMWERSEMQSFTEVGIGTIQAGKLNLELVGSWSPGAKSSGQWRTAATLNLDANALSGHATIYSADGLQRVRDCTLNIPLERAAVDVLPLVQNVPTPAAVGEPSSRARWVAGQKEHVEFMASNPRHRWALIRGQLGPAQMITAELSMPTKYVDRKVPVIVMSHGSDGITSGMRDVWAKPLNDAGYAVFMVDTFTPRNSAKIAGTDAQLTWNTTFNISDAIYALKYLSSQPQIDAARIYHIGWSRGANAVTGAMWPNYRLAITKSDAIKWAGSIAVYLGCNLRYKNPTLKITSPVLYLLGEKDDMTPSKPCVEEAQLLAVEGNPIAFKIYPGAYHVFDRLNQRWITIREGTYAKCALDVKMPAGVKDIHSWGPGFNRETGLFIETPEEFDAAVKKFEGKFWVTAESNPSAREQSVKDMLEFVENNK